MSKVRKNFTLSQEAIELLKAIAQKRGLSQSATLELIIRQKAEDDNLKSK